MKRSNLSKLDIKLNGDNVDALSALIHRDNAYTLGKKICLKLKELIPRQQFEISHKNVRVKKTKMYTIHTIP